MSIPQDQRGDNVQMLTLKSEYIAAQYAVVDVSELVASNHLSGAINESYPQALQPRNRTTFEAVNKLAQQSQNIEFSRLNASEKTDIGAPIIGEDMIVESGNGRVMALCKAYAEGNAHSYRYNLWQHAKRFGLHPNVIESINRPVLVRVRLTAVNRAQFAKDCNVDTEISQSEKLAKNGRLFESALDDALSELDGLEGGLTEYEKNRDQAFAVARKHNLSFKGRSLLANIANADNVKEIARFLTMSLAEHELRNAKDPKAIWLNLAATHIKNDLANGEMRVTIWTNYSEKLSYDGTGYKVTVNNDIDFWRSDIIDKAIGDGLGTQPIEAEVFHGYIYALKDVQKNTISQALTDKSKSLQLRALANELTPLVMLTNYDLELAAKVIYAIFGTPITSAQVDELLNPPEVETDMTKAVPELFPPSVTELIDSCYDGFVNTLSQTQREESVRTLFYKTVIDDNPYFKKTYEHEFKNKVALRAALWGKYGALNSMAREKYEKRNTPSNRDVYNDYQNKVLPVSKEAEALTRNLDLYFDRGVMPSANAVGIEILASLKSADFAVKSAISSKSIERVTNMLDELIASNAAMPSYSPVVDAKRVKGQITRFNKKNSEYKQINPLPNIIEESDKLNRLVAGNLPKDLELFYERYRASYSHKGGDNGNPKLNIGSGCKSTMWHELGHALEYKYPAIFKAAKSLLIKRALAAKEPTFIQLNSYTDNAHYDDSEFAVNNFTFSLYAMKINDSSYARAKSYKIENLEDVRSTEIVSTAFELLSSPERIAKLMSDKEHFSIAMAAVQYLKAKRD